MWGFEAKGRVTVGTAQAEEANFALETNPHLRIEDSEVNEFVTKDSERFQVLQHSYVYDFDTVVLAIGDSQSILIRSYIIDFSRDLRESFDKVLSKLKDIALDWAYPDEISSRNDTLEIPEEIIKIAEKVPTINGLETLQGTANLWHTLRKLPTPFPSLRRLIPSICAYWNAVKGGSDTTTKLMDDCILQIPKTSMNMETVAITRLIQILMVLDHRLFQCTTNTKPLDEYPSLLHWRHAASHRFTFHKSLLFFAGAFSKELEAIAQNHPVRFSTPLQLENVVRRSNRRAQVDGILPSRLTFAPTLPTRTPVKINMQIANDTASEEVQHMVKHCVGIPMQVYPSKSDHKCANCGKIQAGIVLDPNVTFALRSKKRVSQSSSLSV